MFVLCLGWLVANVGQSQTVPAAVSQAEQQRIAAIRKASAPTICIFPPNGSDGGGSGVVISADGYAVTNFHVVKPCGNHMRCGMNDGRLYDAVLVGLDPTGDVALIKLLGREDFPTAEMVDSDDVQVGDWCFAVGNPFLLAYDFQPTITYGIVSGTHRYQEPAGTILEYTDCIQTDAAINPGNSGGPLFNADGQLIGINGRGSFEKRGRVNVGVGYAISINQVKHFLGYLRSGRIVDHATLGATVGTDEDGRTVVTNILDSSDAYRRGLRYGDELVYFGNRNITSANDFKNVLGIYPKGWRVPLSFRRDGKRTDTFVRLAGVHSAEEIILLTQGPGEPEIPIRPNRSPNPDPNQPPDEQPPSDDTPESNPHKTESPDAKSDQAMPAEVAALFAERRGYANYYFNELETQRIWSAFLDSCQVQADATVWNFHGQLRSGGTFQASLKPDQATLLWKESTETLDLTHNLDNQLVPEGTGGLLPTFHLWQRMLKEGPKLYGSVYYLGQAPIPQQDGLFDVLIGIYDIFETRFYFSPQTGQLVLIETSPDPETDPCEIYLSDYRQNATGQLFPMQMEVRFGDQTVDALNVETFTSAEAEQP
ncbi:MAG: trypsin-like peptidase domain-containing protein [Planctomycetales bacterium]|nr:trypsin-like peptidase domain-containing protein [Planctomycetales bacterium]